MKRDRETHENNETREKKNACLAFNLSELSTIWKAITPTCNFFRVFRYFRVFRTPLYPFLNLLPTRDAGGEQIEKWIKWSRSFTPRLLKRI
jgi:hypothetical protein